MKKVLMLIAFMFCSVGVFAQQEVTAEASKKAQATKSDVSKTATTVSAALQDFKEIKVDEVPDAVLASVKKMYPTATLSKFYVTPTNEYKIDLTIEDQKATVFTDARGNIQKK